jgi:hypothetical protein
MRKLMVVVALLVLFTGSAIAADWNFYGSARVNTTYTKFDNDPFTSAAAALGLASGTDTKNYEQNLYGNARIGAKIKVSDELTGQFEYGALGGVANLRILWAEWNFGAGSLGVGQNYTPLLFPYSNQTYSIDGFNKGDHNMSTFGMLYGSRKSQLRLKMGGFQIALVEPKTTISYDAATTGVSTVASIAPGREVKIPSIQAKYKYDFDNGHIAAAGGYQKFDINGTAADYSVTSYIVGVGGRLDFGGLYLKGNVWGGQNVGNMADILVNGAIFSDAANAAAKTLEGDGFGLAQYHSAAAGGAETLTDRDAYAALIVVGYAIRKGLYLEAGYGHVETELDTVAAVKDDADTYYIQSTIFLAPGVFLTPEVGRVDMRQDGQPDATYFGIKWQVNF